MHTRRESHRVATSGNGSETGQRPHERLFRLAELSGGLPAEAGADHGRAARVRRAQPRRVPGWSLNRELPVIHPSWTPAMSAMTAAAGRSSAGAHPARDLPGAAVPAGVGLGGLPARLATQRPSPVGVSRRVGLFRHRHAPCGAVPVPPVPRFVLVVPVGQCGRSRRSQSRPRPARSRVIDTGRSRRSSRYLRDATAGTARGVLVLHAADVAHVLTEREQDKGGGDG